MENDIRKFEGIESEIIDKMNVLFCELIRNADYLNKIRETKSYFLATKITFKCPKCEEDGFEVFYMKLAHKTQEEYEKRLEKKNGNSNN